MQAFLRLTEFAVTDTLFTDGYPIAILLVRGVCRKPSTPFQGPHRRNSGCKVDIRYDVRADQHANGQNQWQFPAGGFPLNYLTVGKVLNTHRGY